MNSIPIHSLDLDHIRLDGVNREKIDKVKLAELAASMAEHGLLEPILVKAGEVDVYHLVIGERRLRAAQSLNWKTIPGRVLPANMSDAELAAIRLVENLQREDLTPFEEANQLEGLRAIRADQSIEDLADWLGKTPTWVAQRLAIGKLTPAWRKLVEKEQWPLGHLPIVARLPESAQKELYREFEHDDEVPNMRQLLAVVNEFQRNLSGARWKRDDAKLVPAAGACSSCPKRTSAQALLFPEIKASKEDYCLDSACWQKKEAALVQLKVNKLREKEVKPVLLKGYDEVPEEISKAYGEDSIKDGWRYQEVKKETKGATPAVWVSGREAGREIWVKGKTVLREVGKKRPIDQETGKPKPKTVKERLKELEQKRMVEAVAIWAEQLTEFDVPTELIFYLAASIGTYHRQSHRNAADWDVFRKCTKEDKCAKERLWGQLVMVMRERLKRFGPIASQANDLWQEAIEQSIAIGHPRAFDTDCWKRAVETIKMPKSLASEVAADPHGDGTLPELGAKKKGKGAA